jgi:molybdopterin-synthase adenylyltransferase
MLSADELERYARHIVLREVGGPGQAALKEASVLVIGAGGLGAPALMYLAAAGVGALGVVDDDIVSLSNLQRQIIHTTPDIGRRKVDTAAERIYALNPHVQFAAHATRLDSDNAMTLIGSYDLVLDGSDNFETRYLVSDACFLAGKPLITAALGQFDGSLTTIRAHEKNAEGEFNPTYRCLFPEPPPPGTVPACAEAGVMGALAGVLGSMMALEAIRFRRGPGRAAPDGGRPRHAVRDPALRPRSLKSAQRRCTRDHRSERTSVGGRSGLTACWAARGPAACGCRGRCGC